MPEDDKKYCVVCETGLGDEDLDGICRACYKKAKGPAEHPIKPEHLFALEVGRGLSSLVSWLVTKAVKNSREPAPKLTGEEEEKRLEELRDRLKEFRGPIDKGEA